MLFCSVNVMSSLKSLNNADIFGYIYGSYVVKSKTLLALLKKPILVTLVFISETRIKVGLLIKYAKCVWKYWGYVGMRKINI